MKALQQFRVHHRSGANDLGAARANPGHLRSLLQSLMSDLFYDAANHLTRGVSRGAARSWPRQVFGRARQSRRRARGSNNSSHTSGFNPILYARNFSRHKSLEPFQFALAWRIVLQKFSSEPHRSKRQADRMQKFSRARKSKLTTPTAKVNHQNAAGAQAPGRDNPQVNEARLFQSRNDFDRPSGRRAHPLQKGAR